MDAAVSMNLVTGLFGPEHTQGIARLVLPPIQLVRPIRPLHPHSSSAAPSSSSQTLQPIALADSSSSSQPTLSVSVTPSLAVVTAVKPADNNDHELPVSPPVHVAVMQRRHEDEDDEEDDDVVFAPLPEVECTSSVTAIRRAFNIMSELVSVDVATAAQWPHAQHMQVLQYLQSALAAASSPL